MRREWVEVLAVVLLCTSCGGSRPGANTTATAPSAVVSPLPQQTQAPTLVEQLGLKLVLAAKTADGLAVDPRSPDYLGTVRNSADERSITIPDPILLPYLPQNQVARGDLFFLVSKTAFSPTSIREVTYSLLKGTALEVPIGQASLDASTGEFYIPLTGLLGPGWTQASGGDRHVLILEVTLEDDKTYEFHTEFAMIGFPTGATEAAGPDLPATPPASLSSGISHGQPIFIESVSNPTGHAVVLWMHTNPVATLALKTHILRTGWRAQVGGADPANSGCVKQADHWQEDCFPLPYAVSSLSSADMVLTSVSVGGSQSLTLSGLEGWNSVPLPAKSSVTLSWRAGAVPGTPVCGGLGETVQNVDWKEAIHQCSIPMQTPANLCTGSNSPFNYYKSRTDALGFDSSISGISLSGTLGRELFVAEPGITEDQLDVLDKLPADIKTRVLKVSGERRVELQAGVSPSGSGLETSPDSCQGTF